MVYPFMTLNDNTEIVHSEYGINGRVKVYMETPDAALGFKHATCYLPNYEWEDIRGYSEIEIRYLDEFIHSVSHIIMQLSKEGGFDQEEGAQAHVCKSMEEALEQEARETRAIDIKNLMEEMNLSAEQAMKALRIPQDEQAIYARLIE